jgi:hypothetical protein
MIPAPMRGLMLRVDDPIKGKRWQGRYRKRLRGYRLIFIGDRRERIAETSAIRLTDEQTDRRY